MQHSSVYLLIVKVKSSTALQEPQRRIQCYCLWLKLSTTSAILSMFHSNCSRPSAYYGISDERSNWLAVTHKNHTRTTKRERTHSRLYVLPKHFCDAADSMLPSAEQSSSLGIEFHHYTTLGREGFYFSNLNLTLAGFYFSSKLFQ